MSLFSKSSWFVFLFFVVLIAQAQSYTVVRSSIGANLGSNFQSTNPIVQAQYLVGQPLQSVAINLNSQNIFQGFVQPLFEESLGDFFNPNLWDVELQIYPNPVLSTLFLDSERFLNKNMVVKVIDLYGRSVLTSTYHQVHKSELDVSALAAGAYIIQINVDTRTIFKRFTKLSGKY